MFPGVTQALSPQQHTVADQPCGAYLLYTRVSEQACVHGEQLGWTKVPDGALNHPLARHRVTMANINRQEQTGNHTDTHTNINIQANQT
jgi:hypothetical protein